MVKRRVRELMVAREDYATVDVNTTMRGAMMALEEAQERHRQRNARYSHRALLVVDASEKCIGKLSMIDVLRALVPSTKQNSALSLGFDSGFVNIAAEEYEGLSGDLAGMCAKLADTKVKEIMTAPSPGEYVAQDASLETAIQQLLHGRHQSLLVTDHEDVVGILRLSDVFHAVFEAVCAANQGDK